jgi:ADP-dependent NAD(P)H-hydrate dehydratase / NAD(P)H-hydrate epimerase
MRQAHSVEVVRAAEGALMARLPDGALMRRAAFGLAATCARSLPRVSGARVVLLVGSGDNGGDALYAGALLARRGARVRAVLAGSRVHQGGLAALRRAGGRDCTTEHGAVEIARAELIVDGLVGIGGKGGLREPHAGLAAATAESDAMVVAVDLPSGIDADTGAVEGAALRADLTVTFGTVKPGLLIEPGAEHAGVLEFVDIGLGPELAAPEVLAPQPGDIAALLPRPGPRDHKYSRGVLGVATGSARFPGAPGRGGGGAQRAGGAGVVRYLGCDLAAQVVHHRPETLVHPFDTPVTDPLPRASAWIVGSGRGTGPSALDELRRLLATDLPVLVDADGLTLLAESAALVRDRSAPTVLTPHAGELARLLGDTDRERIEARGLEAVRRAARKFDCTVLLKGSTTLVADPQGPVAVNPTGTPLLATAGSGDVLSGVIGSYLAAGLAARDAAMCGAYLHGLAARLARQGAPVSAGDLAEGMSQALRLLDGDGLDAPQASRRRPEPR